MNSTERRFITVWDDEGNEYAFGQNSEGVIRVPTGEWIFRSALPHDLAIHGALKEGR